MKQVLQGIDGVVVWIDNIFITGKTENEHLENIEKVLERLLKHGIKAKSNKCSFLKPELKILGFEVSQEGMKTCKDKVDDMINAPRPENRTQLRAFLGLINYYGRFLKNLATEIKPLNDLLSTKVIFQWNDV